MNSDDPNIHLPADGSINFDRFDFDHYDRIARVLRSHTHRTAISWLIARLTWLLQVLRAHILSAWSPR
jgi:hypothetical protein